MANILETWNVTAFPCLSETDSRKKKELIIKIIQMVLRMEHMEWNTFWELMEQYGTFQN